MLAASPLFCLPVPAMAQATDGTAVDIHSHAGNLIRASYGRDALLLDVAGPDAAGRPVRDLPLHRRATRRSSSVSSGRLRPSRDPQPGELYDFSKNQFAKLHELARSQSMPIVKTAADLRAARRASRR